MADLLNQSDLNNKNIKAHEKFQSSIYLQKQSWQKIDSLKTLAELSSRNEVIEKAIDFYFAYITSQLSQDFLCGVYGKKVEGIVGDLANRMARLQFKQAVEMDIITRLLANDFSISKEEFNQLRKTAVECVKKQNGAISLYDAVLKNK